MSSTRALRRSAILLSTSVVGLVAIVSVSPNKAAVPKAARAQICVNPAPIPAGFDYPQAQPVVEGWVSRRDEARAREHGWYLWAALNTQAAGQPVWRSWCTSTQAFAGNGPSPSPSPSGGVGGDGTALNIGPIAQPATLPMRTRKFLNGAEPINFPVAPVYALPDAVLRRYAGTGCIAKSSDGVASLVDGPSYENNGDIMIAGVTYNQTAYEWIRSQNLYRSATMSRMMPPAGTIAQIPAMPRGSIVLKPMMWPVARGGFTALPVWDHPSSDDGRYAGYEIQSKWPRAVALTTTPQALVRPGSVTFLHGITMDGKALGPNSYQRPQVVGTDQFYRSTPDLATMHACDRAILDASAWWAYGRMFEQGDQLVMVAMHIMTKEQPAWTFQSVWWHDRADQGPYAANRPNIPVAQAPGPWRNYLMTSTYGIPAAPGGSTWPVAYNPYIELAADHPIETNCMNCHHRAAFPNTATPPKRQSSYLQKGGPGALDIYDQRNPIFQGLLQVDSMWAISDRVPSPPSSSTP